MKAKSWLLSGVLAASMAGAVGGASAQTYVYSVDAVPSPTGQSAAVFLSARDGEEVTATVQAYNAAGVLGDDAWNVTVPGNGFVRLNNSDLALGHDTGARKVVVMAGRELNVTAMRRIWADHAVALAVRHWVTNAVPPAMPGCADEAEFNRLAVGNEFVESEKGRVDARFLFQDGNRFVQTFDLDGGELDSGSYMYRKVGPNTAMIRVSFESGDNAGRNGFFTMSCTSPTTGTFRGFYVRGAAVAESDGGDWEILPPVGETASGSR